MAGDYDDARRVCRKACSENGACYSITKMDYIYSGGEESGFVVNLINYPRFPRTYDSLLIEAKQLANRLSIDLCQGSYTITTTNGNENIFFSRRP